MNTRTEYERYLVVSTCAPVCHLIRPVTDRPVSVRLCLKNNTHTLQYCTRTLTTTLGLGTVDYILQVVTIYVSTCWGITRLRVGVRCEICEMWYESSFRQTHDGKTGKRQMDGEVGVCCLSLSLVPLPAASESSRLSCFVWV